MTQILTMMISSVPSMIGDNVTTTLFLGDLSIYCQEKEVFALFRPYGPIESIQIKRSDETMTRKPHLSYGFVKFEFRESAERALMELNGKIFLGRAIRLGWASNNLSDRNYQPYHIKKDPTAQIHITFLCPLDMYPITEEKLRLIFERFGEIVDVTINRVECNQESFVHSGYGFIHYPLNEAGINSALLAIETLNDHIIDSIVFKCTMSHGLENYLKTRNSTAFAAEATIPRPSKKADVSGNSSKKNLYVRTNPVTTVSPSPSPFPYHSPLVPSSIPRASSFHSSSLSSSLSNSSGSMAAAIPIPGDYGRPVGYSSSMVKDSRLDSYFSPYEDRVALMNSLSSSSASPTSTSSISTNIITATAPGLLSPSSGNSFVTMANPPLSSPAVTNSISSRHYRTLSGTTIMNSNILMNNPSTVQTSSLFHSNSTNNQRNNFIGFQNENQQHHPDQPF